MQKYLQFSLSFLLSITCLTRLFLCFELSYFCLFRCLSCFSSVLHFKSQFLFPPFIVNCRRIKIFTYLNSCGLNLIQKCFLQCWFRQSCCTHASQLELFSKFVNVEVENVVNCQSRCR